MQIVQGKAPEKTQEPGSALFYADKTLVLRNTMKEAINSTLQTTSANIDGSGTFKGES
jgi:hypothetical protein